MWRHCHPQITWCPIAMSPVDTRVTARLDLIWKHVLNIQNGDSPCWNSSPLTQSTVQSVPTRHRRHACIKMQTALSGNTRTWPNVVSILVQGRWWGGGVLKQHWVKSSCLLGSTQVSIYTHPSSTMIFSPADQGTFSKTSQTYYNTWNWEWGTYDITHLQILTCEVAVSTAGSVLFPLNVTYVRMPLSWSL